MREETKKVLALLENIVELAAEPRIFFEDKEQIGRVTDQVISIFESEKMTYADTHTPSRQPRQPENFRNAEKEPIN